MGEQEIIAFMLNSMNEDNRAMCAQAGMSKEEIAKSIEQSTPSINFMMTNLYHRMKAENLLA